MLKPVELLQEFIVDLDLLAQQILIQSGVDKNSNLVNSIEFKSKANGLEMLAADYYLFVSTGRKPRARKVPINDLITWIKSKGIASSNVNNIAWAIQTSIFKNGIKGKNYITRLEDTVADSSSELLATALSEAIADDLVEAFEPLTK